MKLLGLSLASLCLFLSSCGLINLPKVSDTADDEGSKRVVQSITGDRTCSSDAVKIDGHCWSLSQTSQSCSEVCQTRGGYDDATLTYVGSQGNFDNCFNVMRALNISPYPVEAGRGGNVGQAGSAAGCYYVQAVNYVFTPPPYHAVYHGTAFRALSPATTAAAKGNTVRRACACLGTPVAPPPVVTLTPPAAPSQLVVTSVSPGALNIQWQENSTTSTGVVVERKLAGGSYVVNETLTFGNPPYAPMTKSWTFYDIGAGANYVYRIRSTNAAGSSGYSNELSVLIPSPAPNGPNSLTSSLVNGQIQLSWQKNNFVDVWFLIYRSEGGSGNFILLADIPKNLTSYLDTLVLPGNTYTYRVKAYNAYGQSGFSNDSTVPIPAPVIFPPAAPVNLQVSLHPDGNKAVLYWNDVSFNETEFYIERKFCFACPYGPFATVGANTSTYTTPVLERGNTHFFRVRALNGSVSSGVTNEERVILPLVPSTRLPFMDNFQQFDSNQLGANWVNVNGQIGTTGTFAALKQAENGGANTVLAGVSAYDTTVNARISVPATSGACAGLIGRYRPGGDMYAAQFCGSGYAGIFKNVSGVWYTLALGYVAPAGAQEKTVTFSVVGASLKFYFNGVLTLGATDYSITGPGSVGMRLSPGGAFVKNFSATSINISSPTYFATGSISARAGAAYRYLPAGGVPGIGDSVNGYYQSTLVIYEEFSDGTRVALGHAHSPHADVENVGLGRFSHWLDAAANVQSLVFSASDNSNPLQNGREYFYTQP